eukprot:518634-Alexandrium_andersonii.AAC.1
MAAGSRRSKVRLSQNSTPPVALNRKVEVAAEHGGPLAASQQPPSELRPEHPGAGARASVDGAHSAGPAKAFEVGQQKLAPRATEIRR